MEFKTILEILLSNPYQNNPSCRKFITAKIVINQFFNRIKIISAEFAQIAQTCTKSYHYFEVTSLGKKY